MRVLLVLHGWPPEAMGGTGLYVRALARALAGEGAEVHLLSPRPGADRLAIEEVEAGASARTAAGDGAKAEAAAGLRAWRIALPAPTRWEQTWARADADALFADLLRRLRPAVVHVHHLAHASLGWLRLARLGGARLVLSLHDYALPCARGQLVDHLGAACPGPRPERCAVCLREQAALSPLTARLGGWLRAAPSLRAGLRRAAAPPALPLARVRAREQAVAEALRLPHRLLSPSEDLARRFAALGLPRPELLPLPLVQPIPPAPPPGEGPLRLLFASSLIPTKGPQRLLDAFAALPAGAATLSLAGPCPPVDGDPGFARRLRARAEATPGVRWLGEIPPGEVPALLAAHDVLALPSTWPENSPLVLREASAAGLRAIVPRQGGCRELLPEARAVETDEELRAALLAEIARGRGRLPPRAWPSPAAHARHLLAEVYPTGRPAPAGESE